MKRVLLLIFALCLVTGMLAQEPASRDRQAHDAQNSPSQPAQHEGKPADHQAGQAGLSDQLTAASERAAGEEEDDTAAFKESASVRWIAGLTGLSAGRAYWLLVAVNFGVIAVLIFFVAKSRIPALLRSRTASIEKSMEEARKASEDATRRLGDIEQRLAKLDVEIAGMRAAAEADVAAEEQRIRAAVEEDKRKVVEMAEQEIAAATRSARRELRAYVAGLAAHLAEGRIQVDPRTDQALVLSFVEQLGEDAGNGVGKEKR